MRFVLGRMKLFYQSMSVLPLEALATLFIHDPMLSNDLGVQLQTALIYQNGTSLLGFSEIIKMGDPEQ